MVSSMNSNRSRTCPTGRMGATKTGLLDYYFCVDFDGWMKRYTLWTDERPLQSRCVTSAITASIGALLASAITNMRKLNVSSKEQRRRHDGIDWLEIISFAVHGGLVAGPISHYCICKSKHYCFKKIMNYATEIRYVLYMIIRHRRRMQQS